MNVPLDATGRAYAAREDLRGTLYRFAETAGAELARLDADVRRARERRQLLLEADLLKLRRRIADLTAAATALEGSL